MATEKLVDGLNAFGYAYGFGEEKIPANLEIKGEEVELTLLQMNKRDDFFSDTRDEIPATVMFRSTEVTVNLSQLRERRSKMQLFTGLQTKTYRCGRAVHTVADIDHKHIHGMRSEIEGFDRWANQFAISQQVELDSETNGFKAYTMKAQLRDAISLGSRLNVEVGSGFTIPSPARYSTTYSLHNIATLETRTDELCSWEEHRQVHRMIQDLLCLAYGYPCSLELKKVLRDDNQPKLFEEIKSSGKRVWNESKEEDFGRKRWFEPNKDFSKTLPLFSLEDTDVDKLSVWIDEFEKWSRPTWIAVESIFQPYLAAESRMLQIGAALEALGYAIWLYDENEGDASTCGKKFCKGKRSKCQKPGCNKPNAAKYFERVSKDIPLAELGIAPEESAETWSQTFNEVYKGCKHADNSLPDGEEAYFRAKQGLQVIRCWLAKRLGVSDETLMAHKDNL